MAAKNTETVAKKRATPKKIILDISATISLSDISTSRAEKSKGWKFGIDSTWAIRRVSESERKASPSTKSKSGTSAIVAAIASAPTTTEDSEKIAIPAISTLRESIFSDRKRKHDDSFSDTRPGAACPKSSQSQPKSARTATKHTKSELPLKALNQSITSRLTTPSGARSMGRGKGEKPLPGNYQSVARRVTMTIVALPILFVTSWVLWDRFLGQEKKSLLREPPMVPGPPMAAEMEARNNRE
ncbi:hypothetical protein BOTCAL_0531g00030 [Botryotinia calthae]|uniref:Uncharacterized protein n=1 Tax=Botryotinia calthae TaxID=38488 RepID=A0A4Y8CL90_9HELO|nr:hypothetical protein BOTCAL_0531g00030 [Botryotinia calthae]